MLLSDIVHHIIDCVKVGANLIGTCDIQTGVLTHDLTLLIDNTDLFLCQDDTGALLVNSNILEKVKGDDALFFFENLSAVFITKQLNLRPGINFENVVVLPNLALKWVNVE